MPQHFNSVNLLGNLTREPELRYTPNNTAVADFGLAVNNPYTQNDDDTVFIDVTVWNKGAENASEYLDKGQSVFVDGRLEFEKWESDDGTKNSKISVTAENVIYLHDGGAEAQGQSEPDEVLDDVEANQDEEIPF